MNDTVKTALKLRNWVKVAHHFPGRMRLKYKLGIIMHLARFNSDEVEQVLNSIPAFHHYQINKSTGSIVLEYNPQLIQPSLLDQLFSNDDQLAEQACYSLAQHLNLDGAE